MEEAVGLLSLTVVDGVCIFGMRHGGWNKSIFVLLHVPTRGVVTILRKKQLAASSRRLRFVSPRVCHIGYRTVFYHDNLMLIIRSKDRLHLCAVSDIRNAARVDQTPDDRNG